jgi:isopentenyl diphosphate isomerase/L-lactate dehydrogenase-like FMN-dependent dehydrogenase
MSRVPISPDAIVSSRRRLLRLLAASPLAAAVEWPRLLQTAASDASTALDVFDLETAAKAALPPAHFGYLATGTDDDVTLRANREAFGRYQLRVRRLVNVGALDLTTTLFGAAYASPLVMAPIGSQRAFHPDGELAAARVARGRRQVQILSSVASVPVEEVNEARGEPVWYQLYPTNDWEVGRAVLARAERAGCRVLVLTVDNLGNNRLTEARAMRQDPRPCQACHKVQGPRYFTTRPMFAGLDLSRAVRLSPHDWSWDYVKRVKDATRMRLVIKGLVTREDAELAIGAGADGIIVSNHGGRAEDSGRGAIECLREVVEAVAGRVPVLVDSGFRRGTDIFKALALGAAAVCIGRPYVWGLAGYGQPGVEKTFDLLTRELEIVMRQAGTRTLAEIGPGYVIDRSR